MAKKKTVVLVSASSLEESRAPNRQVAEVRYVRDRDEPAFQRAWQRISDMKAQGKLNAVPPAPTGGIRLRGRRTKQVV